VRIDRLTQGVAKGALFDEEIDCGGRLEVRFELRRPEPGEVGLLVLLLKDLLSGDLAVGGTVSIGRGTMTGSALLAYPNEEPIALDPLGSLEPVFLERLDREIGRFRDYATLTKGEAAQ
jgi:hypothetical protein